LLSKFRSSVELVRLVSFINYNATLRILLLFTAPFAIRLPLAFILIERSGLTPDQILYVSSGKLFLTGLSTGSLAAFTTLTYHPPLSMLISGALATLLAPFEIADLQAVAIQNSIFGSATCVVAFLIGRRYSPKVGWLAWGLLSLDVFNLDYVVASLDITATFFVTLTIFYFLRGQLCRSGIALGLATVSKYPAFPIMLIALVLTLLRDEGVRKSMKHVGQLLLPSILMIIFGLPFLYAQPLQPWAGSSLLVAGVLSHLSPSSALDAFLNSDEHRGPFSATLLTVSIGNLIAPALFALYSPTIWLFLVSIIRSAWIGRRISGEFTFLAWIAGFTLVFTLILKRILYYGIMVEPALVLYSSQELAGKRRTTT